MLNSPLKLNYFFISAHNTSWISSNNVNKLFTPFLQTGQIVKARVPLTLVAAPRAVGYYGHLQEGSVEYHVHPSATADHFLALPQVTGKGLVD